MSDLTSPLTERELYALFDSSLQDLGVPGERLEAVLPGLIAQFWVYRLDTPGTRWAIARTKILDFKTYLVLRGHYETALRLQAVEAMLALENL